MPSPLARLDGDSTRLACGSARHQAPSTSSPKAVSAAPYGRGLTSGSRSATPWAMTGPGCDAVVVPQPARPTVRSSPAAIRNSCFMGIRRAAAKHRTDDTCPTIRPGAAHGLVSGPQIRVRTRQDLARQRRHRRHRCWDHLIAAPLWPQHGNNLGTLLRTCDAVGACLAVPRLPWVPEALARGNTLSRPACVHWTGRDACGWPQEQRTAGTRIVGVELAEEAIRLADPPAARQP